MSDDIQVRTVNVELLRSGPSHNQLLSPLTQYLGICDGAEAGLVAVPFEHEAFMRRLKAIRDAGADRQERLPVVRDMGVEMAKVLGAIPRLPGALTADAAGPDTLVHLRLVLSASELALLPFELSKIPIGPTAWSEGWLSLQARVPVVITRRTRDVSAGRVKWPRVPRILFITSDPDQDGIPFDAHRQALLNAVEPYLDPDDDAPAKSADNDGRREQFGDLLTILKNARFDDVVKECADHIYTHIHILAHGDVDSNVEEISYGLVLRNKDGEADLISGERLASAFARLVGGAIHRPTVVTLASCDLGDTGSVLIPGASIAHALHRAGIPLVVASQFPLSMDGSNLLVNELYPGLLRAENPWSLLHRIRTGLHGRLSTRSNDWASLVVYEALPASLEEQLEEARYVQGRRAVEAAFAHLDEAMLATHDRLENDKQQQLIRRVVESANRLPMNGPYAMECLGLRARSRRRLAEAEFHAGVATRDDKAWWDHLIESCRYLEQSLRDYELAGTGFLVKQDGKGVQRMDSMHWVLVQQLRLCAILGKPARDGIWETAKLSAEMYLELRDAQERAWACATLAELWLLRLTDPKLSDARQTDPKVCAKVRKDAAKQAHHYATELIKLARADEGETVQSTRAQFDRYKWWWGNPQFEDAVVAFRIGERSLASWKEWGVLKLAGEIVDILDQRSHRRRSAKTKVEAPSPPPAASFPAIKESESPDKAMDIAVTDPIAAITVASAEHSGVAVVAATRKTARAVAAKPVARPAATAVVAAEKVPETAEEHK